jgi:hypothetical protein
MLPILTACWPPCSSSTSWARPSAWPPSAIGARARSSRASTRGCGERSNDFGSGPRGGIGETLGGIAVHIGARVTAMVAPDEVLVSSTVKDLVTGSGLRFQDRGVHGLRRVTGEWRLFAVERLER